MTSSILHRFIERDPNLRPQTRKMYLAAVDRWIEFASADPDNWTRYKADEFYRSLLETMKPQSAKGIILALRSAASWWATYEGKPELDFTQIKMARAKDWEERKPLTPTDAVALLRSCWGKDPDSMRDYAIVAVGLETGLRRSSLVSMTIEKTGSIPNCPYPAASVFLKGTDDPWNVPLSDIAMIALQPLLEFLRAETGPLFRNVSVLGPIGDGISDRTIYNIIKRRADHAGITADIYPHLFRNTFMTWRLEAGYTPLQISAITAHITGGERIGAASRYFDKQSPAFVEQIRNSTPRWIVDAVSERARWQVMGSSPAIWE